MKSLPQVKYKIKFSEIIKSESTIYILVYAVQQCRVLVRSILALRFLIGYSIYRLGLRG